MSEVKKIRWRTHLLVAPILILAIIIGTIVYLVHGTAAAVPEALLTGRRPKITEPKTEWLLPSVHISQVVGWQGGARPIAAPGLTVSIFSAGLDHPRWLLALPNGDVLVSESNAPAHPVAGFMDWITGIMMRRAQGSDHSPDKIILLRDTKGLGVADQRFTLLEGLHSPSGMALVGETLYVADTDALLAYSYKIGETKITSKPEKIIDLPTNAPNMHWARNVIASADGKLLYVTVGSSTNIADNGIEAEQNRAAVLEVDPVKKDSRIYAAGLRNPNGLALEPHSGGIWSTVNERDQLGPDLPPDYMTRVEFGADYGWPYAYWGGYMDTRVDPNDPGRLQYYKRPEYALGAHTAPLGIVFTQGARLGGAFGHGAIVAEHGSWNRRPQSGYRLVYIPFGDNDYPLEAKPVELLSGFLDHDGNAQGRPVDVVVDKTGALLVSDDAGNRIWRVIAK